MFFLVFRVQSRGFGVEGAGIRDCQLDSFRLSRIQRWLSADSASEGLLEDDRRSRRAPIRVL